MAPSMSFKSFGTKLSLGGDLTPKTSNNLFLPLTLLKAAMITNPVILDCPNIAAPEHGSVFKTMTNKHLSAATFSCDNGYERVGSLLRNCFNGTWSHSAPSCKADCPNIDAPEFGFMLKPFGNKHSSEALFSCNEIGYEMVGSHTSVCNDGRWSEPEPVCKGKILLQCDFNEDANYCGISSSGMYDSYVLKSNKIHADEKYRFIDYYYNNYYDPGMTMGFDVKPDWNIYSGEACVSFTYWVQHTTKVWIHSEHALFPNPPDSDLETGVHLTLYPYNKQGIKQVGYAEVSGMAGDEIVFDFDTPFYSQDEKFYASSLSLSGVNVTVGKCPEVEVEEEDIFVKAEGSTDFFYSNFTEVMDLCLEEDAENKCTAIVEVSGSGSQLDWDLEAGRVDFITDPRQTNESAGLRTNLDDLPGGEVCVTLEYELNRDVDLAVFSTSSADSDIQATRLSLRGEERQHIAGSLFLNGYEQVHVKTIVPYRNYAERNLPTFSLYEFTISEGACVKQED